MEEFKSITPPVESQEPAGDNFNLEFEINLKEPDPEIMKLFPKHSRVPSPGERVGRDILGLINDLMVLYADMHGGNKAPASQIFGWETGDIRTRFYYHINNSGSLTDPILADTKNALKAIEDTKKAMKDVLFSDDGTRAPGDERARGSMIALLVQFQQMEPIAENIKNIIKEMEGGRVET